MYAISHVVYIQSILIPMHVFLLYNMFTYLLSNEISIALLLVFSQLFELRFYAGNLCGHRDECLYKRYVVCYSIRNSAC